ncbi:SHP1 [Candida pseudojiufengensis]|uniref:SHP1 n=1 Tax=Candida pseudojiufengensis TaxID=497109 RepID=UPI0022241B9E|nr:SHP1 [Candida pseudojiufengensis]KAI5966822.1 SHP1 [Candida pseudojiufengensis]
MSDDSQIAEFVSITNASKSLAEQYIQRNNGDLVEAIEDFYANNEHSSQTSEQHQPPIAAAKSNSKPKKPSSGIRTFRDLNEDEDDEDERTNNNFFTGGEKSGLQVEDPNKDRDKSIIDQIFQRAKDQMNLPDDRPSASSSGQPAQESFQFSGTGFKLGDGNEPSEPVEDPNANMRNLLNKLKPKKVNREITFWKQGFTVGDSELYSYNDPRNQRILNEIEQGRVPINILQVDPQDDVDVTVSKRTDEDYAPPKRKVGGYHGSGHRLGSPVPGEPITSSNATTTTSSTPTNTETSKNSSSSATQDSKFSNDQGNGDTLVQIRFANGKKVSHKFNSTDSIKTVYNFVRNHELNSDKERNFTLSHAFPVKPIEESEELTVADANLKNAVIVQRWV